MPSPLLTWDYRSSATHSQHLHGCRGSESWSLVLYRQVLSLLNHLPCHFPACAIQSSPQSSQLLNLTSPEFSWLPWYPQLCAYICHELSYCSVSRCDPAVQVRLPPLHQPPVGISSRRGERERFRKEPWLDSQTFEKSSFPPNTEM